MKVHLILRCIILCTSGILYHFSYAAADSFVFTFDKHHPLDKDYIERLAVEGIAVGESGNNVVWNFSGIEICADTFPQQYVLTAEGYRCKERGKTSTYHLDEEETVYREAYRTNLENIEFEQPQIFMTYPLSYGDSISAPFSGKGLYCGKYPLSIVGERKIKADAYGKILLPDNVILDNVLRLHCTTLSTIHLSGKDLQGTHDAESKQEIKEEYFWMIKDSRYPIFEYVVSSSYHNGKYIASRSDAYCLSPTFFMNNPSAINDSVFGMRKGENGDSFGANCIPIEYAVTQNDNVVKVQYKPLADIDIIFLISSTTGILSQQYQCKGVAEEEAEITFDCRGYRPGSYILYINAGGQIFSTTFNIE